MVRKRHSILLRILGLGIGIGLHLGGCVNEPGPVGSGLIPGSDLLQGDSLDIVPSQSRSILVIPDTVNSLRTTIAIGKKGAYEAWGLVLFTNFGSAYDSIAVQTAELRLKTSFHLGDSLGQFSLAVRKALATWTRSTFAYTNLREPGFYEEPARSTHGFGSIGDTADITISLDTALVNSWFRSDTTNPNYGIVLEPLNSSVIKGFLNPQLVITYIPSGSSDADTVTFTPAIGNYGFVLGGVDTLALQDSVLLHVRAGAASRAVMQFDISGLPAYSAIHRALLEIWADESLFDRSSNMQDSLMATFRDELGFIPRFEALSSVSGSGSAKLYTLNLTPFVQYWVQNIGIPEIGIRARNERNGIEAFMLHGTAAIEPLKPRLRILYTSTRQ
jgi:hypothetical protein